MTVMVETAAEADSAAAAQTALMVHAMATDGGNKRGKRKGQKQ